VIRRPAAILALLTGFNLLNYLDRNVLYAVMEPLRGDLHISKFLGGLLTDIFLLGYAATSPLFGHWADRAGYGGRKKLIALGVAVWSLATIGSGIAQGKVSLIVSRAFIGVGEASYATIAPTIIDDLAPPALKSRWMGIFYAATPLGSALGYIVGGAVLHWFGWRTSFFVAGVPGFLLAILCLAIVEPERTHARERVPLLAVLGKLWRSTTYARSVAGYCAYTFAIGGFAAWAPTYLDVRYKIEAGHAGVLFGLVTVLAGFIGTLLGGALADRRAAATRRRLDSLGPGPQRTTEQPTGQSAPERIDAVLTRANLDVCVLSCALGAPLAAAAILAPRGGLFFAFVFPCEIALFLSQGPINVAILRSVPSHLRASAMALSILAIHALGDAWSPPLIGLVADHAPMELAMYAGPLAFALGFVLWWRARASVRLT
jgi:MFS family permease